MGTLFRPQIILIAVIGAVAALGGSPALAQSEDTISATVTPQVISITISDGDVDYRTLDAGETNNTISGTALEQQTITNQSNVAVNISLRSSDADDTDETGGAVDWDLVSCATAGSATDDFGHQYEVNDANATFEGTDFPADGTFANVATGTVDTLDETGGTDPDATLDLGICMPGTLTDTSQHDVTVTAIATEA